MSVSVLYLPDEIRAAISWHVSQIRDTFELASTNAIENGRYHLQRQTEDLVTALQRFESAWKLMAETGLVTLRVPSHGDQTISALASALGACQRVLLGKTAVIEERLGSIELILKVMLLEAAGCH